MTWIFKPEKNIPIKFDSKRIEWIWERYAKENTYSGTIIESNENGFIIEEVAGGSYWVMNLEQNMGGNFFTLEGARIVLNSKTFPLTIKVIQK